MYHLLVVVPSWDPKDKFVERVNHVNSAKHMADMARLS
jgi:hypothetical protein